MLPSAKPLAPFARTFLTYIFARSILDEVNRKGGNAGACHGQMSNTSTLVRHGSPAQKRADQADVGALLASTASDAFAAAGA